MKPKYGKLAVDGGEPALRSRVPPPSPGGMRIDTEEEEAVLRVLRSKRLFRYYGADPRTPSSVALFEKMLSEFLSVEHVLGVNSGTSALSCAMAAMGIGPEDEVIIPAYAWASNAASVISVGAVPVLAEIDDSFCVDPTDLEQKRSGCTRLVMPVHMGGMPCDMDPILQFSERYSLSVLEDVAQALGATYKGAALGSIGDCGIFSFQWNKMITSGEGGAIATSLKRIYDRSLMYHDVAGALRVGDVRSDEILPGNVLRMSELQGAILAVQLKRVPSMRSDLKRNKRLLSEQIDPILKEKGVRQRRPNDVDGETATDLFLIFDEGDIDRVPFILGALVKEGVLASGFNNDLHVFNTWAPLFHKTTWTGRGGPWRNHPREIDYYADMCPQTTRLMSSSIRIPLSPDTTPDQREQIGEAIEKVLHAAI